MAKLPEEYVDIKQVRHRVEHLTLPLDKRPQQNQILEELTLALTNARKAPN